MSKVQVPYGEDLMWLGLSKVWTRNVEKGGD